MQSARRFDTGHAFALAAALLLHAAFLTWVIVSSGHADERVVDPAALDVIWIERAQPATEPLPPEQSAQQQDATIPPGIAPPVAPASVARQVEPTQPVAPEPSRPLSAVFIEQGKALERRQPVDDFGHNPLTASVPSLGDTNERIRMREPMTAAKVVARIGQVFGGPGYETSPCPRIRRNIAALGTGGDSELLQEEVRRHRQFCE